MKDIYKCTVCGYVYNPEEGDPISGIREGTPFKDIPASWTCPLCGASVEEFQLLDE